MIRISTRVLCIIFSVLFLGACNGSEEKKIKPDPSTIIYKKDTSDKNSISEPDRPPIINITDTIALKRIVVLVKDSANSSQRIGLKLSRIYDSILPAYISKNKLKRTGPRIAWYKSSKAPFYFEAGFPVDRKPASSGKKITVREIGGDSAVVAHFYGPYESTYLAYQALTEWLKDHNKKSSAPPYEIYVGEPFDEKGNRIDAYKILTDIVFPRK